MLCHPLNLVLSGFAARAPLSAVVGEAGLSAHVGLLKYLFPSIIEVQTKPHFDGPYALDGEEGERARHT